MFSIRKKSRKMGLAESRLTISVKCALLEHVLEHRLLSFLNVPGMMKGRNARAS